MVNEREPWTLTVGELREALNAAQPNQVVIFSLSADYLTELKTVSDGISIVLAVQVDHASHKGPIFRLSPAGPHRRTRPSLCPVVAVAS